MRSFEITYLDLNKAAQKEYLNFVGASSESDINMQTPITNIEIEDDCGGCQLYKDRDRHYCVDCDAGTRRGVKYYEE